MRFKSVAHFFVHSWSKSVAAEELFRELEESGIGRMEAQKQLEVLKDAKYLEVDSSDDVVVIKPLRERKDFKKKALAEPDKPKPIRIISLEK
jgi:hypothetical protein